MIYAKGHVNLSMTEEVITSPTSYSRIALYCNLILTFPIQYVNILTERKENPECCMENLGLLDGEQIHGTGELGDRLGH